MNSSRKILFVIAAVLFAAAITLAFILPSPDTPGYSLRYTVTADPSYGDLAVDMVIDIAYLSDDRTFNLYKGLTDAVWKGCTGDDGAEIPFADNGGIVSIGPVPSSVKEISFKYDAKIGTLQDSTEALPYTQGVMFGDLLSFSGEYAFLLPFADPSLFDSMEKHIKNVSIDFDVPDGWQSVIPYNTPLAENARSIRQDSPTWDFFNAISKSAFSFGYFKPVNVFPGGAPVFADLSVADTLPQNCLDALSMYIDYYAGVFGQPLGQDVPIVLLRNHPYDNSVIVGGVGSRGSAISSDMRVIDDFRALSSTVFHSYFDSIIKPRALRYVTGNWIYSGLSDYYVNLSASLLPDSIKAEYDMGDLETYSEKYLKYLYFSLKEPGFLALNPADEAIGMYAAQKDYYFSVKVPIMIDLLNYLIGEKTGTDDGFIKRLAGLGVSIDLDNIMRETTGSDYESVQRFFAGHALVPNYKNLCIDDVPEEDIIDILEISEQAYSYLFSQDKVVYQYPRITLLNEAAFLEEAVKLDVKYNTSDVQAEVRKFSNTLHRVLMQYAARAKLAGVDDITAPDIRATLFTDETTKAWDSFCEQIGYEISVT